MQGIRATTIAAFAATFCAGSAVAAEIRLLSVGSVQVPTRIIAAEFQKATGHKVLYRIVSPDRIAGRLASEPYDVLIASVSVIDALEKAGAIRSGTRVPVARAGIGVMVRDGTTNPDISTPESFKTALLAARSIVHGDPDLPNQSGVVTMRILEKAGILDEIRPKARVAPLAAGLSMVARGDAEIGLFNQVELPPGVRLAGAVPSPLQDHTFYEVAVLEKGGAPEESRQLIRRLTADAARATWEASLLDAYPYR